MNASAAEAAGPQWLGRAHHQTLIPRERPVAPEQDPFYAAPEGFEHSQPGTVLRSRDVALAFLGLIPQKAAAIQLLYRTTDMDGHPTVAVTTVVVPSERDSARRLPIVSYQCAIDAITGRCFPSYALRRGARVFGGFAQLEYLLVAAALSEGWAVSIPDHEGTQGIWGVPRGPGYHVLDGVRAALNTDSLGLSRDAPVGLWGYSGGGLATAWAAETYADYAPELNVGGAVLGSPVADLGSAYRRLNGTLYSGLPAMVVAALTLVYPDLARVVDERTTPAGKQMLRRIRTMTTVHALLWMARKDMGDLVDWPLDEVLDTPEVREVFDGIKLGTTVPALPMLVVQAVNDKIISVHDIDDLVETYVRGGADVAYHRDGFSEHLLLHALSAPMALRWLRDRFADRPTSVSRARTRWPTLLNASTYRGMLRLALICAKVITGRRLERRPLSLLHR